MLKLIYNPRVNWNYLTEPETGSGDRAIRWPRGRVLGGSSSINGMLYVRGNPADFDGWAQMGCRGWSYDDVLPYFRQSEDYGPGDAAVRGKGGVLKVEDYRTILPLTHRFVEAAQQAGHPFRKDLNGREQEGVGYSQMTRQGRFRASTARTFLQGRQRPRQPHGRDQRPGDAADLRGPPLRRRPLPPRRRRARGARHEGGHPLRRRRQLAAPAAGLRHRPGGAPAIHRRGGAAGHAAGRAATCRTTTSPASSTG